MFSKLTPNMMVQNVQQAIKFYQDILGFDFVMGVPQNENTVLFANESDRDLVYALIKSGNIEIMFQEKESLGTDIPVFAALPVQASVSFYFEVVDVDSFYEKIKSKVTIVKDIDTTWYGMREFYITDCNGYILGFARQEEQNG